MAALIRYNRLRKKGTASGSQRDDAATKWAKHCQLHDISLESIRGLSLAGMNYSFVDDDMIRRIKRKMKMAKAGA